MRVPSPGRKAVTASDYVQHVVVGGDGRVTRTTNITLPHRPMMHDFALTEKYVVLFDLPVTFSMTAAMNGVPLPYTWNPEVRARVGLLPRDGSTSEVRWLEVEPCWVFHTLNAYDDPGGRVVVVDLTRAFTDAMATARPRGCSHGHHGQPPPNPCLGGRDAWTYPRASRVLHRRDLRHRHDPACH
jgi:carotenoid cleavage dioxygenase-like enzyme